MQEEKEKRELPGALKTLAGVAIVFLLLAAVYVFYQAMQVLFPPNTYETALLATVEDTVDAEGVLLFNESYVAGDGTLGYLVADGERVSAGTAPAADPDQRPDRPAAKIAEHHLGADGVPAQRPLGGAVRSDGCAGCLRL